MIRLYFIEGISKYDEPTFDTEAHQTAFFLKHEVEVVDTGFYPPHYNNKIKLEISDFDLRKQINYLSLEYNNKIYYYFIDDINYVNEDLYELIVTMDVIQTYMFNIHCNNVNVNRMSISRWKDNKINREYIRENISEEQLILADMSAGSSGYTIHVAVCASPTSNFWSGNKYKTTINIGKQRHALNMILYPFIAKDDLNTSDNKRICFLKADSVKGSIVAQSEIQQLLGKVGARAEVSAIYKMPIEYLGINRFDSYYVDDEEVIAYDFTNAIDIDTADTSPDTGFGVYITQIQTAISSKKISLALLGFSNAPNNKTKISFSEKFCPQMLDSNYCRITFGDSNYQSTYPLEYLEMDDLQVYIYTFVSEGSIAYLFNEGEQNASYVLDDYQTLTFSRLDFSINLLTNAYQEYDKANKARLLGFINSELSNTINAVPSSRSSISEEQTSRSKRIKGRLRATSKKVSTSMTKSVGSFNPYLYLLGGASSAIDYVDKGLNAILEPNTLRTCTTSSSMYTLGSYVTRLKIFKSPNLESIAKYFETTGYAVNKFYNAISLFSDDSPLSLRYYFNVIKCVDIDLSLHDCPSDNATLDNIAEIFYQGLRLWRVDYTTNETYCPMSQPTLYDNVERSYIQ